MSDPGPARPYTAIDGIPIARHRSASDPIVGWPSTPIGDDLWAPPDGGLCNRFSFTPVMTEVTESDAELAHRICGGDRDALGILYDRHAATALAVALRIVGDRSEAEDVVHDAFVALWRAIGTFDPTRGPLASWLLTLVRNRAIDRVRARRATPSGLSTELLAIAADDPNPTWRATVDRLTAAEVRHALACLPAEQRQAIELAYFDGYTYRDVARLTGVPPGTASSRLRLGLGKLRDLLAASRPTTGAIGHRELEGLDR